VIGVVSQKSLGGSKDATKFFSRKSRGEKKRERERAERREIEKVYEVR